MTGWQDTDVHNYYLFRIFWKNVRQMCIVCHIYLVSNTSVSFPIFHKSCYCVFLILPSYHRAFTIEPSCIAVQGDKIVTQAVSKRNTVIGRYLNDKISRLVEHIAGISRLASHLVPRLRGHMPLNSIIFIF
jgi:hypothetical protein